MGGFVSGIGSIIAGRNAEKTARRTAAAATDVAGRYGDLYGELGDYYGQFAEPAQDIYGNLTDLITGVDYSSFRESPGYQYSVDQGLKAIERAGAAGDGTGRFSGATLKALQSRGQNLADQEFANYLGRLGGLFDLAYGAGRQQRLAPINALAQQAPLEIGAQRLKGEGREARMSGLVSGIGQIGSSLAGLAMGAAGGMGGSLGNLSGFQGGLGGFNGIPYGGFAGATGIPFKGGFA